MKKIIESFVPLGGKHCITNSLKQIFSFCGYPMTEEMIFGVASGLAFAYINLTHSPMVSGRTKIFEFENKLAQRLNINIKCKQSKNYELAFRQLISLLDRDIPVLIYADMPYLDYLNLDKRSHFGGHTVVVFGYDDAAEVFYVSDRDNEGQAVRTPAGSIAADYHLVKFADMESARSSRHRPFPANNKYLEFDFSDFSSPNDETIAAAIIDTCESMLNPGAKMLGLWGMAKFAWEIRKWSNFDMERVKTAGITNYFQISGDGGTGGGIFRRMYGDFLIEADAIIPNRDLTVTGAGFVDLSLGWDKLADSLWLLGQTGDIDLLTAMSVQIVNLCELERSLLIQLQKSVSCL